MFPERVGKGKISQISAMMQLCLHTVADPNPKPPSFHRKCSHKKWEQHLKLQKITVKKVLPSPSNKHFSDSGLSDKFLLKPVYSYQEEL